MTDKGNFSNGQEKRSRYHAKHRAEQDVIKHTKSYFQLTAPGPCVRVIAGVRPGRNYRNGRFV